MLYFLYGEDAVTSGKKLQVIKEKFLVKDSAGSGLSVFDYEEKEQKSSLLDVISTPNLLAPKRLIISKNLISSALKNVQEEILEFLKKEKGLKEDQDVVVIFWEGKKIKKGDKLYKFLEKNAKSQAFEKPVGMKLNQWVQKKMLELDPEAQISRGAQEKLIFYAGRNLFSLVSEIEKLVNYAGGKMIDEDAVDLLVQADFDINIFNTIDALGNRNKKEALGFLHQHLKNGEDPFYVFSMFVYQFRNLLKISDLKENYQMSEQEIAKATKLHPFVVKKSLAQSGNFSFDNLKKIYQKLSILDTKIKTGQIDIRLALDKFVVEI